MIVHSERNSIDKANNNRVRKVMIMNLKTLPSSSLRILSQMDRMKIGAHEMLSGYASHISAAF